LAHITSQSGGTVTNSTVYFQKVQCLITHMLLSQSGTETDEHMDTDETKLPSARTTSQPVGTVTNSDQDTYDSMHKLPSQSGTETGLDIVDTDIDTNDSMHMLPRLCCRYTRQDDIDFLGETSPPSTGGSNGADPQLRLCLEHKLSLGSPSCQSGTMPVDDCLTNAVPAKTSMTRFWGVLTINLLYNQYAAKGSLIGQRPSLALIA
jgi:hypothetical protein